MSEYWVSKGKYWCQYCKIFVTDDKPSRQHHETSGRHKGSLERYIRDIYKKGAQKEKDKANEDREMKAINAAAARAMGQTVEPAASSSKSEAGPTQAARKATSSDQWSNYTTAASLGYVDEDAARLAAEEEKRKLEGTAGEWTVVSTGNKGKKRALDDENQEEDNKDDVQRELQEQAQQDPDRQRISFSHLKERSLPQDTDDDLDNLVIKVRKPKEQLYEDPLAKAKRQAASMAPAGGPKPVASAKANGNKSMFKAVVAQEIPEETLEQLEARNQAAWDLIAPTDEDVKPADVEEGGSAAPTAAPMFKKRKGASSSARRRD